jgi:hypothetical protein
MTLSSRLRGVLLLEIWLAAPLGGCGRTDPVPDDDGDDLAELVDDDDEESAVVDELPLAEIDACGDGKLDDDEQCDPAAESIACNALGLGAGVVACTHDCMVDVATCAVK